MIIEPIKTWYSGIQILITKIFIMFFFVIGINSTTYILHKKYNIFLKM